MSKRTITIATRESPLALCQAELVKTSLLNIHPELEIKLLGMTTIADIRLDVTLDKIGGKGLFVKELEEALYAGKADIAVHSLKDVPMILPPGLTLPVILEREDPRDVLVSTKFNQLSDLPPDAVLGTSSLRRQTQIKALRGNLKLTNLRGNIHTRLKKLHAGEYDAIVLAAAGLNRLRMTELIKEYFTPERMLPAAGQGALGIECRLEDVETLALIESLNHLPTSLCVTAERAVCQKLNGGCLVPIGAFAELHQDQIFLRALISNADGSKILYTEKMGSATDALLIGLEAGDDLIAQGAEAILQEFRV